MKNEQTAVPTVETTKEIEDIDIFNERNPLPNQNDIEDIENIENNATTDGPPYSESSHLVPMKARLCPSEDLDRKNQFFSFRKESPAPTEVKYQSSEPQLLQEGKLGASEFSARLRKVLFGTYDGITACLILLRVDSAPKNTGWFWFRNATIDVEFEDIVEEVKENEGISVINRVQKANEEKENYTGCLVLEFYPQIIRGHIIRSQNLQPRSSGFVFPTASH